MQEDVFGNQFHISLWWSVSLGEKPRKPCWSWTLGAGNSVVCCMSFEEAPASRLSGGCRFACTCCGYQHSSGGLRLVCQGWEVCASAASGFSLWESNIFIHRLSFNDILLRTVTIPTAVTLGSAWWVFAGNRAFGQQTWNISICWSSDCEQSRRGVT